MLLYAFYYDYFFFFDLKEINLHNGKHVQLIDLIFYLK